LASKNLVDFVVKQETENIGLFTGISFTDVTSFDDTIIYQPFFVTQISTKIKRFFHAIHRFCVQAAFCI